MAFCTQCGAKIPDTATFCTQCGHKTARKKPAPSQPEKLGTLDAPKTLIPEPDESLNTLDAPKTIIRENTADQNAAPIALASGLKVRNLEGQTIGGRFSVTRELGRGGMGVVYLAHDDLLDSNIALKVLPDELRADPEGVRDLIEEVKNTRELSHPNIVRMYEFHQFDDLRFLAMEYIDGPTLIKVIADRDRLPVEEVSRYVEQLSAGLSYAHSRKVIHRDIKPHNLMTNADGIMKICDFGIARVLVDTSSRVSQRNTTGTLVYMSPEQYTGHGIDFRADIYSSAATAYHLLAGHPPFHTGDIAYQLLNIEARPIEGVPDRINAVLLKALSKDPSQRYPSVASFGDAFLGRGPVHVAPPQAQTGPPLQRPAHTGPQQPQVQTGPQLQRPAHTGPQQAHTGPQQAPGRPMPPPVGAPYATGPQVVVVPPNQMRFAGWWRRLLAMLIDSILILLLSVVVGAILSFIPVLGWIADVILPIVFPLLYFVMLESGKNQATLGKQMLGMKVVDLQGRPLTGGTAFARNIGKAVSSLALFIGWFTPIFSAKKQAMHDMMAGTVVIKV